MKCGVHRLTRPPGQPTAFDASAASLIAVTNRLLEEARVTQTQITTSQTQHTATFANTIVPLANDENNRLFESQLIEFYGCISHDEEVRNASEQANDLFLAFDRETATREALYRLIAAVAEKSKSECLTSEQTRLVDRLQHSFRQNGFGLLSEQRARFEQVNTSLQQLRREYLEGCRKRPTELWFPEAELDGIDSDFLRNLERDGNGDRLRLVLSGMRTLDIMSGARYSSTRRRVYIDSSECCRENVERLQRIIALRQERAQLLGYSSHAELRAADGLEKSASKIRAFLDDLLVRTEPLRRDFSTRARQLKREDLKSRGEVDDGNFYIWDRSYYANKLASQEFQLDDNKISEYFALDETITRMLNVFEQVMGLRFVELSAADRDALSPSGKDGATLLWHQDVRMFAVWDDGAASENPGFLGYLYMDMYTRPGKVQGASCRPIRPAYTDVGGKQEYNSSALICNFNQPGTSKPGAIMPDINEPCLLRHYEVVLVFHELGHGIHDLCAHTEYARFHGAGCGEFNEAPSQMLEQFCWDPQVLRVLSQHYKDLSPLPEDLIAKMVRGKRSNSARVCVGMLNASLFDMEIAEPQTPQAANALDTTATFHSINKKVFGLDLAEALPPMQATKPEHVTVDAMYIYLTTQVYAQDMFASAFAKDPMNRQEGLRYRRTILAKGSSEDEMKILAEFLGRLPSSEAYFKGIGC